MDRRERGSFLVESLIGAFRGFQAELWTAIPGIIQSYDSSTQTCTIQPSIKAQTEDITTGVKAWVNLPVLVDCPVYFPAGGGFALTFPIVKGDEALVVFSSRCIDNWWASGQVQNQAILRMHDLSDGFVFVGFNSQPKVMPNISTTGVEIRSLDGATSISLEQNGAVNIKGATTAVSSEFSVEGDTTTTGAITAGGDIGTAGDLNVSGQANIAGSAYGLALASGFVGSELAFLTSLLGSGEGGGGGGNTILNGEEPPTSGIGVDGDFYIDTVGLKIYGPKASGAWPSGVDLTGPAGADGLPGVPGIPGTAGTAGSIWRLGSGAPSDTLGLDSDLYLDTTNYAVYQKVSGAYTLIGSIKGATGLTGPIGATGPAGPIQSSFLLSAEAEGTTPYLVGSVRLPAGTYNAAAMIGCSDPSKTATIDIKDGASLVKAVGGVAGAVQWVSAGSSFTISVTTQLDIYLYGNTTDTLSYIRGIEFL
jgi:hypothetical protein